MEIRPILSTLRRHKTAAMLIVLEIALSCAIICNALFLISQRMERTDRPTGLANEEIVRVNASVVGASRADADARHKADVAALRQIPGVIAATSTNHLPFDSSSWNSSVSLQEDQPAPNLNAAIYMGDEQLVETFGLRIVAGRDFTADEYVDWGVIDAPGADVALPGLLMTRAVAEQLWPGENPIGKSVYVWGEKPIRVIGVLENLIRPNDNGGPHEHQYSIVLPIRPVFGRFVLRTTPDRRAEVLKAAVDVLERNNTMRIINDEGTFTEMVERYYRQDRSMAWLLVAVCVALLVVTALGIVGLASFWVQQRTKQIGVRRALGATRRQVLRYFQTENFVLATVGIALGMFAAFAINQLLMERYELPRLPLAYLPIGALALWALGQISVLGPALRAAAVPPAVATRSV
ncbi:ABC transporter permease [Vulcaniibacterium thermophilum]|uniref:ABC transporter permease n=1 Tax=Vulcaniibacterium thermophilum TaxID=1169913 RepID=A0A918Z0A9_9GAMM|nr:FtsX-like permease family protein [Vulcaniibacterium thermophilum]GHE31365.1 ABC transporter permease [Vulcaniibacterium thermophilum]